MILVKFYLDTNIIFGFFKNSSKNLPKNLILIKKFSKYVEIYTSFLTLSEIICNLNTLNLSYDRLKTIIKDFGIKIIEKIEIDEDILIFNTHKIDEKDGIHLLISKKKRLIMVTNDKMLIERGRSFYQKIISFEEFKHLMGQRRIELRSQPCKGCVLADRLLAHSGLY